MKFGNLDRKAFIRIYVLTFILLTPIFLVTLIVGALTDWPANSTGALYAKILLIDLLLYPFVVALSYYLATYFWNKGENNKATLIASVPLFQIFLSCGWIYFLLT